MHTNRITKPPIHTINATSNTFSGCFLFSKPNLITASNITNEIIGINICAIVNTKSAMPYCSVVKQFVYNGTKKNRINFDPILPNANIKVSFTNLLYLLFMFITTSYYSFTIKHINWVNNTKANQHICKFTKPTKQSISR